MGFARYDSLIQLLQAIKRQKQLVGGVSVLAVTQLGASIAGLLRERILNHTFAGNLSVVDAYLAAFRPSDLLFQTCIMSAMGTVLVPVLASYYAKNDNKEMSHVLSGITGIASLVFGIVALILAAIFPWIAPLLVKFQGETLQLYITFGRLALLVNFFFVFGNSLGQYLITVQRYWIYGITPILYTLGTIGGTLFLTSRYGAYAPMVGTVIGVVIYVLLRLIAVARMGATLKWTLWHPDVPEMGRLMLPRILAFGAFQIQLLFLDRIASGFPAGSVTINNNTRNFQSVLVGVVGIAIAQAVYSILSQSASTKDSEKFRRYFLYGTWLCLILTIPGSIALAFMAPLAASLVHLSQHLDTFQSFLIAYAISIPFESLSHLQYRAFYAMKQTLIPATFGVLGGGVAIIGAIALTPHFGVYSIAAGYTLGEIVQTVGLAIVLPWQTRKYMNA